MLIHETGGSKSYDRDDWSYYNCTVVIRVIVEVIAVSIMVRLVTTSVKRLINLLFIQLVRTTM